MKRNDRQPPRKRGTSNFTPSFNDLTFQRGEAICEIRITCGLSVKNSHLSALPRARFRSVH